MKNSSQISERGFVLSEILVAMVVTAIAVISFLHLVQDSTGMLSKTRGLEKQRTLAHSTMQIALNSSVYDAEPYEGVDEVSGLTFKVTVSRDLERQSSSPDQPSISMVTVEVRKFGFPSITLASAKWMKNEADR